MILQDLLRQGSLPKDAVNNVDQELRGSYIVPCTDCTHHQRCGKNIYTPRFKAWAYINPNQTDSNGSIRTSWCSRTSTTSSSLGRQETQHRSSRNFDKPSALSTRQFLQLNNLFAFWEAHLQTSKWRDITISLEWSYYNSMLKHMNLDNSSNATSTLYLRRPPVQQDSHLDPERHYLYGNMVRMLIWAAQVHPDLPVYSKGSGSTSCIANRVGLATSEAHS